MLSQNNINISRYRVILEFCGKYLNYLNVNDKLSDHGIKQDSVIIMLMKCVMTNEVLNSLQLNKNRYFAENSLEDVKSDKKVQR